MDENSTEKIRNELGINPISWCETPSPGTEADPSASDAAFEAAKSGINLSVGQSAVTDGRLVRMRTCRRSSKGSKPKKHPEPWNRLSTELILHIFNYLEPHDLASCARVCQYWKRVTYDESLWRTLTISDRRISPQVVFHVVNRNPRLFRVVNCDLLDFEDDEADVDLGAVVEREVLAITRLELCSTRIGDHHVISLLRRSPGLRTLDLANASITDETLLALAKHCPALDSLRLQMVPDISSRGIKAIVMGCSKLRVLSLGWVTSAKDFCPYIAEHCKNLERLDLSGCCSEMTDDRVRDITVGTPKLQILDLSDCYHLTNDSIDHICDNLPQISSVSFSRCHLITVAAMWRLAKLSTLKNINLLGCYPVNFEHIKNAHPHLAVNEQKLTYLPPFS